MAALIYAEIAASDSFRRIFLSKFFINLNKSLQIVAKDLFIAIIIVFLIINFIGQFLQVKGQSMEPTLREGNFILINKLYYRFNEPQVDDIISFSTQSMSGHIVKRIIAVEGDTIEYFSGTLYVNGLPINDPDIHFARKRGDIDYPFIVPEGYFFTLGDNLNNSIDSRYEQIGLVEKKQINGKIIMY